MISAASISSARLLSFARSFASFDFGSKSFWQKFYADRQRDHGDHRPFEWFIDDDAASDLVAKKCREMFASSSSSSTPQQLRMLHVGCGTSALGTEVVRKMHPFAPQVFEVDYEASCLDAAQLRARALLEKESISCLSWFQADARRLPRQWNNQFDVIVDKGTLDAMVFAGQKEKGATSVKSYASEIRRVSRPSASLYLQFTDEGPETRLDLLNEAFQVHANGCDRVGWLDLEPYVDCEGYYLYMVRFSSHII